MNGSQMKTVRVIPPKPEFSGENRINLRPKRVAAYCRVSTDREEQEHSFETQKEMYTELIIMKPTWQMAGIRTLDRVEIVPTEKLSFIFQSGIRITV